MAVFSPNSLSLLTIYILIGTWVLDEIRKHVIYSILKRQNGAGEIPEYPHKDPVLGLDLFFANRGALKAGKFLEHTTRQFETYGMTFKSIRLGQMMIKTIDSEIVKATHATHFEEFGLKPLRYGRGKRLFGNGIVIVDDPIWSHARALIRPSFEKVHVANFERLHHHVDRFMRLLPKDNSTVDLLPLLRLLVLDTSSEFIFGESMNALSLSEEHEEFMEDFAYAQRGIGVRTMMGKFYHLHHDKKWLKACDKVHGFCDRHVEKALERRRAGQDAVEKNRAPNEQVKGRLRLVDEMAKETQDSIDLRYQILAVFSPAHDSTALTVGNALFHLARHPEVWTKLRAEIVPTKNEPLTYDLLQSYKYLEFVFKETHRLTPLATVNQRMCLKTTVLPSGGGPDGKSPLLVRKGDIVEMNYRALMRSKNVWGSDAEEFKPERWEHERPAWNYTPFGGGPRICPAQRLLYTESMYIAVRILREVDRLENRDPVWEWQEEMRLTFQSKNGVRIGLIRETEG